MFPHKIYKNIRLITVIFVVMVLASITTLVYAANPIITNRFVADPSVHVFDGRVYMYNTDDQTNGGATWDSKDWRAYSSTDLVNWTDHGEVFRVGSGGFTWASNFAWAPAAAQRNGFYYLYLPADTSKIGVARSTSPTSGFTDPRGNPLIQEGRDANAGTEVIDPMVFIDDDGQAYLYYGGLNVAKVVRLNSDMISLNGPIQTLSLSNYAEAPWMHKRNGIYYLSYSTGWPGPIGYSTSNSPLGPFTYRGTVLGQVNTNTNHQAVITYNNQWFMFYHKGLRTGWSNYKRSPAIDCLFYNADGTMRQVVQTTGGVTSTSCAGTNPTPTRTPTPGGPTPTRTPTPGSGITYQAESAVLGGGTVIESNNAGFNGTGFANFPASGGSLEYRNADGGAGGSRTLQFRFALGATSARTGQLIVNGVTQNITFNPTGAWTTWSTLNVVVNLNAGASNTIRLQSTGQDLANQDQLTIN